MYCMSKHYNKLKYKPAIESHINYFTLSPLAPFTPFIPGDPTAPYKINKLTLVFISSP